MSEARSPIELRSADLANVRHPERTIELVAVPYDEWTPVDYKGRRIEESFARGSFGHIQNRSDRFLVNLEHDAERRIGRCVGFDADNERGLLATLRIRRGPEGDQVLDDAEDGMLGASVGFGALPENQQWETRSRRRILKAFLDHIALTWTPAYTGAGVLAVRSAALTATPPATTPNLDWVRLERLAVKYGAREV